MSVSRGTATSCEGAATIGQVDPGHVVLRFDRSLHPLLAPHRRGRDVEVVPDGTSTLGHVVPSLGVPLPEVGRLRVRGAVVPPSYRPSPGDVVDVEPVTWPERPTPPAFLLDVHLGTLARRLRLLGVDTAWSRSADDPELVATAVADGRVLLTRDRGLLRRRALPRGALIRSEHPDEQVQEVLGRFAPPLAPFTRCLACNGALVPVGKAEVAEALLPGTLSTYDAFVRCASCGRAYWHGAHAERLDALVEQATGRMHRPLR
jgi:uncharacterized protein with PIN domain